MKKRFFALITALILTAGLLVTPASAAGATRFADIPDQTTATAVEVLRLMGVLDGYGDGTFRPGTILNRAQFCKMAVYAMDGSDELGRYQAVTIFPDVKPSHWASAYINMAAKGQRVISGYADGTFGPGKTVTLGHAVTITLRMLGYTDEVVGGVWPDSYLAVAKSIGLTDGVSGGGSTPLSRGQAARLFVNLLRAKTQSGGTLYTLGEETNLVSVDGGSGELKTSDGQVYKMANPVTGTGLIGVRGQVVTNEKGEALTFLPASTGGSGVADAAIIVYADRSAAGFEALAGNSDYAIVKNGSAATVGDLRAYDVATYNAATNTIRVCDTRVTVYYEDCDPAPAAPAQVTALGADFTVLPTARDSVAAFKPGDLMTLLLTADGQVAGAVKPSNSARSNAVGLVRDGGVELLCGSVLVKLGVDAGGLAEGTAVRVSADSRGGINLNKLDSGAADVLDVSAGKLGKTALADNVLIYENGALLGLGQLSDSQVPADHVVYARTNWAGKVDLVVLDRASGEFYGRVFIEKGEEVNASGETVQVEYAGVEFGNGAADRRGPFGTYRVARNGTFVAAKVNSAGTAFVMMERLTKVDNVSSASWIGNKSVIFGGRSYAVPEDVLCYNEDSGRWTDLTSARSYGGTLDLYVKDGTVRVVAYASK